MKVKLQIPDYSPRNLVKCGSKIFNLSHVSDKAEKIGAEKGAIDVVKVKMQIPDYSPRNLIKFGSNNLQLVVSDQVERNWN